MMNRLRIHQNKHEVDFYFLFFLNFFFSPSFLVTDSSVDSSSDERLQASSTTLQNVEPLQRKISDRKIKRVRAKQNDVANSASSSEVLKKRKSNAVFLIKLNNFCVVFLAGSEDDDKRTQKRETSAKF